MYVIYTFLVSTPKHFLYIVYRHPMLYNLYAFIIHLTWVTFKGISHLFKYLLLPLDNLRYPLLALPALLAHTNTFFLDVLLYLTSSLST